MPRTDTQFKKGHKLNVGKKWETRDDYHGNSTSFTKGTKPWNAGTKGIMKAWNKGIKSPYTPWNKGKKEIRKEVLENLSNSHKGITPSVKTRKKLSEANKGEKSYLWKGGLTPFIKALRTCFEYRQWRSDVFTRDNHICQHCGKKGGYLEAHHIKSFALIIHENKIETVEEALNCVELWNINNGITLCVPCHKLTDNWGKPKKYGTN